MGAVPETTLSGDMINLGSIANPKLDPATTSGELWGKTPLRIEAVAGAIGMLTPVT
ncbi:hypothetical protein ACFLV7_08990 [Chloroflexota bacterium]